MTFPRLRILIIGATGTIGSAVVAALSAGNEIVAASRQSTAVTVDLADPASIRQMYRTVGKVDAVVCAAGQANSFRSPSGAMRTFASASTTS